MRIRYRLLIIYLTAWVVLFWPSQASADTVLQEPIATPQAVEYMPYVSSAELVEVSETIQELSYIVTETSISSSVYTSGNNYEPGQCVWFIKNIRSEIPNNWGNASEWWGNAQAMGWPTGYEPRVGAIGWTSGHVVLITGVHDGMVDITDMNGNYIPFEIGYGTYPASKYRYIY